MKKIISLALCCLALLVACSQASVESLSGKYQRQGSQETLELNTDGSCVLHQDGKEYRGTVQKSDQGLELHMGIDMALSLTVQDGLLVGSNGSRWVKQ